VPMGVLPASQCASPCCGLAASMTRLDATSRAYTRRIPDRVPSLSATISILFYPSVTIRFFSAMFELYHPTQTRL
jgi:hypothetical protein